MNHDVVTTGSSDPERSENELKVALSEAIFGNKAVPDALARLLQVVFGKELDGYSRDTLIELARVVAPFTEGGKHLWGRFEPTSKLNQVNFDVCAAQLEGLTIPVLSNPRKSDPVQFDAEIEFLRTLAGICREIHAEKKKLLEGK